MISEFVCKYLKLLLVTRFPINVKCSKQIAMFLCEVSHGSFLHWFAFVRLFSTGLSVKIKRQYRVENVNAIRYL